MIAKIPKLLTDLYDIVVILSDIHNANKYLKISTDCKKIEAVEIPKWADVVAIDLITYNVTGLDVVYLFATDSRATTATLPAATGNKGRTVYAENTGTSGNTLTLARAGAETVEGATSLELYDGMGITLFSDNFNWRVQKG